MIFAKTPATFQDHALFQCSVVSHPHDQTTEKTITHGYEPRVTANSLFLTTSSRFAPSRRRAVARAGAGASEDSFSLRRARRDSSRSPFAIASDDRELIGDLTSCDALLADAQPGVKVGVARLARLTNA